MSLRMDIGQIGNQLVNIPEADLTRYTQVYRATHDGEGASLPSFRRSFISFSFGGKKIEDFDLIAYCEGNSMSRGLTAQFEDLTVDSKILDGQTYLGTHFKPFILNLSLVSDGIEQITLDAFSNWFRGGKVRELILAEHPNRAIMARVSAVPQMNMLPFEQKIKKTLFGVEYETSTTVYKGTISLELTAESPFWYAKTNMFGETHNEIFLPNYWNGVDIFSNPNVTKEAVKLIHEDGIPILSMIADTMHFGTDIYAKVANAYYNLIVEPISAATADALGGAQPGIFYYQGTWYRGAQIETVPTTGNEWGRIAGSIAESTAGSSASMISNRDTYYFYYPGTAPSPLKMEFTVPVTLNSSGYITTFANNYVKYNNLPYSRFTITSVHVKHFDITTPSIMTSYNRAVKLFSQSSGVAWGDLLETIEDDIHHPIIREYCLKVITNVWNDDPDGLIIGNGDRNALLTYLREFWEGDSAETLDCSFTFDSYTGESYGTFHYYMMRSSNDPTLIGPNTVTENVGDMVRSNYITLEDKNYLDELNQVKQWDAAHPYYSHKLYHNLSVVVSNLQLYYRDMYL